MRYQQPYGVVDVNAGFVNGDPSIGRAGSIPSAAAFEEPQREIVNAILGAGLTPSGGTDGTAGGDLTQLWKAMQLAPWVEEYSADTGVVNAYAATISPAPPQLYPGMSVRVKIANTNTGASTLAVNLLGAHAIKRASGVDLAANDLVAGEIAFFMFDGSNWQIVNFLGFTSDTTINNFTLKIPYAVDTGAVNAIVGVFSPAITTQAAGDPIIIKVAHANTGVVTLKANGLPFVPLQWPDGTALKAGDLVAGGLILAIFDGTVYQLMNRINGAGGTTPPTNPTTGVTGTIDMWPTETAPAGAYECNGQTLTIAGDPNLYAVIGTRYGSAGAGTFKLPNLCGQFVRGWSHSTGVDPDAATRTDRGDGTAGDHVGTYQSYAFTVHHHPLAGTASISGSLIDSNGNALAGLQVYGGSWIVTGGGSITVFQPSDGSASAKQEVTYAQGFVSGSLSGNTGDVGGSSETRPKNVAMMMIIWR